MSFLLERILFLKRSMTAWGQCSLVLVMSMYMTISTDNPLCSADKPFDKRTETFRVRRYLPDGVAYEGGDYHPPHTDWFETDTGDNSNVLIISMILYLTSPEKGGTTYFPHAWHNDTKGSTSQYSRSLL